MGNVITKLTTNNIQLDESNVSDAGKTEVDNKSPAVSGPAKSGLFKNLLNFDPRSPSSFITRTPIAMFRNNSASKFNHQELNESVESQVDLEILTPEEQNSLNSNGDLAQVAGLDDNTLPDPRSPVLGSEFIRTPIIVIEEVKRRDNNLVKKLADKLISTAISDEAEKDIVEKVAMKKAKKNKNLIFEDDENVDRFSTPPKKAAVSLMPSRTPLSCVANTTPKMRSLIPTSTPKSKSKLPTTDENLEKSASRIPVSARRLN